MTKLGGDPDAKEAAGADRGVERPGRRRAARCRTARTGSAGCSHPGMKLLYEYSFLNPGTPPWEHYPNSGWGGDHGYPHAIACLRNHGDGRWRVAVGGTVGEGGTASFVLDADDRKCKALNNGWNGSKALAAADGMLWICESGSKYLYRVTYHDEQTSRVQGRRRAESRRSSSTRIRGASPSARRRPPSCSTTRSSRRRNGSSSSTRTSGDNRVEVPLPASRPSKRAGLRCGRHHPACRVRTAECFRSPPARPSRRLSR